MNKLFYEEISQSFQYLSWEKGWDGDEAEIVDKDVFAKMVVFLLQLCGLVENISVPYIHPCNNRTIDVSFTEKIENVKIRLLINFSIKGYDYYGDENRTFNKIESEIEGYNIEPKLINWIKENLSNVKNNK